MTNGRPHHYIRCTRGNTSIAPTLIWNCYAPIDEKVEVIAVHHVEDDARGTDAIISTSQPRVYFHSHVISQVDSEERRLINDTTYAVFGSTAHVSVQNDMCRRLRNTDFVTSVSVVHRICVRENDTFRERDIQLPVSSLP